MRYCEFCRQENDDDSLFCIKCGKPLGPQQASARSGFESLTSQVAPIGGQGAFEDISASSAPDAFAQNAPASSDAFSQDVPQKSAQPFPQDTIDIYELNARENAEPEPFSDSASAPAFGSSPAHAATAYDGDQSDVLMAMEDIDERLSTIESLIKNRAATAEELIGKLSDQFESKISRNEHEAIVLKNMSDEMQEYRDGLYEKLALPLIRDLVDAREALGLALLHRGGESGEGASKLAADVELCRDMLADSLTRNAVEIVKSKPGDEFTSFKHKIVGKVHTSDSAQHGRIAEVQGDSYKLGEQYISPAMVKVYTIEETGE